MHRAVTGLRRSLVGLALVAAVGFAAAVAYWLVIGGRWFVVETPSMGTSAPVGTLLWVRPADARDLHVGEFVTFRPPGSASTYSHRIYRIDPDGRIRTQGRLTAPDPWRLTERDIVGRVAARWWGVGWLVTAAPVLAAGGLLVAAGCRVARPPWRVPVGVVGSALVLCVAVVVYRPLTRAVQLSLEPTAHGGHATYVSTGLLPLRLHAVGGATVHLRAGQVGTVTGGRPDARGNYPVHLDPHIPIWFWVALVGACFLPAVWSAATGHTVARTTSETPSAIPPGPPPAPGPRTRPKPVETAPRQA